MWQVVDTINEVIDSPEQGARAVVRRAMRSRSEDNLTCTVIHFGWGFDAAKHAVLEARSAPKISEEVDLFA